MCLDLQLGLVLKDIRCARRYLQCLVHRVDRRCDLLLGFQIMRLLQQSIDGRITQRFDLDARIELRAGRADTGDDRGRVRIGLGLRFGLHGCLGRRRRL